MSESPELPDFDELDLETGNHLIVVVYNEDEDDVKVENPNDLPYHEVLGLLHVALDQWMECYREDVWAVARDEDDDE